MRPLHATAIPRLLQRSPKRKEVSLVVRIGISRPAGLPLDGVKDPVGKWNGHSEGSTLRGPRRALKHPLILFLGQHIAELVAVIIPPPQKVVNSALRPP